ncbi:MAG: hypothetical protein JRE58_13620 [Deltaproteobacteria bacterium]|nr:hypothetical protein [Deltaproteobacteria bacterium]
MSQINDPNPDIITNESYEVSIKHTKQFGKIPKIRFSPNSSQIKAELVKKAGMVDKYREAEIVRLRRLYGVSGARNSKARLFEEEWNNIMFKVKKATFTAGMINQLFAAEYQAVSEPIHILQQVVMEEYASFIKVKREGIHRDDKNKESADDKCKGYDEELEELE